MNDIIKMIEKSYMETIHKFQQVRGTDDESYWQGKKDGMRTVMALLPELGIEISIDAGALNEYARLSENEVILKLLSNFVYHGSALVYEIEECHRTDVRTRLGLRRAVQWYDELSKLELVPVINDHC